MAKRCPAGSGRAQPLELCGQCRPTPRPFTHNLEALLGTLALLCLAGCATNPHPQAGRPFDWQELDVAPPVFAAPPAPVPTLPLAPAHNNPPPVVTSPLPSVAGTWVPLQRWCKANDLGTVMRLPNTPAPSYSLQSSQGAWVVQAGSRVAHWKGLEVHLGFPPQVINGQPYLHTLDLQKTLLPLLGNPSAPWLNPAPSLVIDPGHGGTDSGTRSVLAGHFEKEYTLDWALRLQSLLAAHGWQVSLTRSKDIDFPLLNRVAVAEQRHADLFLSLHFNSAAPDPSQAGLETYCLTPAGLPSNLTRGFADELGQTFPNNAFDAANLQVAFAVHSALLQVNGHRDRGVRRARFPAVLRGQQRPAILVEGGYLSNPREARWIAEPAYRQKLAEAVAGALLNAAQPAAPLVLNRGADQRGRGAETQAQQVEASAEPSPRERVP